MIGKVCLVLFVIDICLDRSRSQGQGRSRMAVNLCYISQLSIWQRLTVPKGFVHNNTKEVCELSCYVRSSGDCRCSDDVQRAHVQPGHIGSVRRRWTRWKQRSTGRRTTGRPAGKRVRLGDSRQRSGLQTDLTRPVFNAARRSLCLHRSSRHRQTLASTFQRRSLRGLRVSVIVHGVPSNCDKPTKWSSLIVTIRFTVKTNIYIPTTPRLV